MRKIFLLIFILFLITSGVFAIYSVKVKETRCVSQYGECSDVVLERIKSVNKGNLLVTKKELNKILKNEAMIISHTYQYQLDGKLVIYVKERQAKYCLTNETRSFYSDETGMVIKLSEGVGANCTKNIHSGYKIRDGLNEADYLSQKIYYKLRNLSKISSAEIAENKFVIEYNDGIKLIFPLDGEAEQLSGRAYYTISQFAKIDEYILNSGFKRVTEIDFRYKNPVVRFI